MVYLSLFRNQWRHAIRSFRFRSRWLTALVLGVLGAYLVFVLVTWGLLFPEMLAQIEPVADPVAFLNAHLLTALLFLFTLRFFLQRTPQVGLQPYLHLPVARPRLVRFFTLASLASAHNVLPLLFFVPFWLRHLAGGAFDGAGPALWLAGVVVLIGLSNHLNILARVLLTGGLPQVAGLALFLTAVVVADAVLGLELAARLSAPLFGTLLGGGAWPLVLVAAAWAGAAYATDRLLVDRLTATEAGGHPTSIWTPAFAPERGRVYNLILLELKLMWRHRRPRTYALLAGVFGTVYVAILLASSTLDGVFLVTLVGVFASGIFALNYGQLMFSWESAFFDGHLARALPLGDLVRAKLLLLQLSCVVFWLVALPIFVWLAPALLGYHAAFMLYNAGVTSALMLALGVTNQKPVDLSRSGAFLNYEGFSVVHWLWFIPTVLPPLAVLYLSAGHGRLGLWLIAALGVAGLLLTRPLTRLFARLLARRRYGMAAGFRAAA